MFSLQHAHPIPFHGSRQQPSFYGLFVFIPNLPISVSPLSNFPNKNAASAGMSQCSQIKFFTKSPWKKILKLPKLGINFQQDGCQDWTKRIFVIGQKGFLSGKVCVGGRRLWDNGDKKFGCQFLWTQPFPFCEFLLSSLFGYILYNHY